MLSCISSLWSTRFKILISVGKDAWIPVEPKGQKKWTNEIKPLNLLPCPKRGCPIRVMFKRDQTWAGKAITTQSPVEWKNLNNLAKEQDIKVWLWVSGLFLHIIQYHVVQVFPSMRTRGWKNYRKRFNGETFLVNVPDPKVLLTYEFNKWKSIG